MKKLIAFCLAACTLQAAAYAPSGNILASWALEYDAGEDTYGNGAYVGLVSGVADVYRSLNQPHAICFPEGATSQQIYRITAKWLKEHPERLHEPSTRLIWVALAQAFGVAGTPSSPCFDRWFENQN